MTGKNIMIVDDDQVLIQTTVNLRKKRYNVKIFSRGTDAVRYLFEEKQDNALLDVRLPDCDGWFIDRHFEQIKGHTNILLIMISAPDADSSKMFEVKPFTYIQKPFDIGRLLQVIESSVDMQERLVAI